MGEAEMRKASIGTPKREGNGTHKAFDPSFLAQLPNKLQDCIKVSLFSIHGGQISFLIV